jgi:hypothetical protein
MTRHFANAFSVSPLSFSLFPGLFQPWAEISERLRRQKRFSTSRNAPKIAAQTNTAVTTYQAGRRLWQVRQRVRSQLTRRSQLRQVIDALCDTTRISFQVLTYYFLIAAGLTLVHKGQ